MADMTVAIEGSLVNKVKALDKRLAECITDAVNIYRKSDLIRYKELANELLRYKHTVDNDFLISIQYRLL